MYIIRITESSNCDMIELPAAIKQTEHQSQQTAG